MDDLLQPTPIDEALGLRTLAALLDGNLDRAIKAHWVWRARLGVLAFVLDRGQDPATRERQFATRVTVALDIVWL